MATMDDSLAIPGYQTTLPIPEVIQLHQSISERRSNHRRSRLSLSLDLEDQEPSTPPEATDDTTTIPPLTGANTNTSVSTPYSVQTPLGTAGPSRLAIVDLATSPSPSPTVVAVPVIKSFPHNADLLGARHEASPRRSIPLPSAPIPASHSSTDTEVASSSSAEAIEVEEEVGSTSTLAQPSATQVRLARIRERVAVRRAERAVEEERSHRRAPSRHIFDPESPETDGPAAFDLAREQHDNTLRGRFPSRQAAVSAHRQTSTTSDLLYGGSTARSNPTSTARPLMPAWPVHPTALSMDVDPLPLSDAAFPFPASTRFDTAPRGDWYAQYAQAHAQAQAQAQVQAHAQAQAQAQTARLVSPAAQDWMAWGHVPSGPVQQPAFGLWPQAVRTPMAWLVAPTPHTAAAPIPIARAPPPEITPIAHVMSTATVPGPRPPTAPSWGGWQTHDRPAALVPTVYQQPSPVGAVPAYPAGAPLDPEPSDPAIRPTLLTESAGHRYEHEAQMARVLAAQQAQQREYMRNRLAYLDDLRAVSRPQVAEHDWLSRPPWWNAQPERGMLSSPSVGGPSGSDGSSSTSSAAAAVNQLHVDDHQVPTPPTPSSTGVGGRPPHHRWLSAGNISRTSSDAPTSVSHSDVSPLVSMWNQSVQQTVDRRLPLEPQRDWHMAQHLGEGFMRSRLDAFQVDIAQRQSEIQRRSLLHMQQQQQELDMQEALDEAEFNGSIRRRLADAAGPGGPGEAWGDVPIDTTEARHVDPPMFRRRPISQHGIDHPGYLPPSVGGAADQAPRHPYLRYRGQAAPPALTGQGSGTARSAALDFTLDPIGRAANHGLVGEADLHRPYLGTDGGSSDDEDDDDDSMGGEMYSQPAATATSTSAAATIRATRLAQAYARYPFPPVPGAALGFGATGHLDDTAVRMPGGGYTVGQLSGSGPLPIGPGYRLSSLASLDIRPDMTPAEKLRVVKILSRGVQALGAESRKQAAQSVVKVVKWGQLGLVDQDLKGRDGDAQRPAHEAIEGMEKETFCSVCHDDYEDESTIGVTPCKHMYHKDCLDIWLQQPNISTCPMCRRDCAALACLERFLPTKNKGEALAFWMSA